MSLVVGEGESRDGEADSSRQSADSSLEYGGLMSIGFLCRDKNGSDRGRSDSDKI